MKQGKKTILNIAKMPKKNLSVDQFLTLAKRVEPTAKLLSRKKIYSLEQGAFLGVHRDKKGKWHRLHLKKIWIKYFSKSYGTTHKVGKEILIASFPLPRGSVIQ